MYFFYFSLTLSLFLCFAVSTSAQLFSILEYCLALHTAHAATVTKLTIIFYHEHFNRRHDSRSHNEKEKETERNDSQSKREKGMNACDGDEDRKQQYICTNCMRSHTHTIIASYRSYTAYLRTLEVDWARLLFWKSYIGNSIERMPCSFIWWMCLVYACIINW